MTNTQTHRNLSGLLDAPLAIVAGSVLAVLLLLQVVEVGFVSDESAWTHLVKSDLCLTSVGALDAAHCQNPH